MPNPMRQGGADHLDARKRLSIAPADFNDYVPRR
jgi:hypothetical protein